MRQEFGGENRELTECQVHTAVAALIPFWWLNLSPPKKLLERTSAEIERAQRRNAAARKCHTKRTRRRLRESGIKLTELPRCKWDATWPCDIRRPAGEEGDRKDRPGLRASGRSRSPGVVTISAGRGPTSPERPHHNSPGRPREGPGVPAILPTRRPVPGRPPVPASFGGSRREGRPRPARRVAPGPPTPGRRAHPRTSALIRRVWELTERRSAVDGTRARRTRDQARQAWYARHRQRRFARFLGFGDQARDAASPPTAGAGRAPAAASTPGPRRTAND